METLRSLRFLWFGRIFLGGFYHAFESGLEVLQTCRGHDDCIAAAIDVFGDSEETSARIFLQGEHKGLSFDLNFFRLESFLGDWGLWNRGGEGTTPIRRWTFIRNHKLPLS